MSLLLMFSSLLLAAPVECQTLETMHRAGVNSAYMVDLVMNSEIDAATVACLERGGVPAEVAYAARYRMEQDAALREWAKAQVTLINDAAYDLAHGDTTSAAQKTHALLNASPPNEFAAVIYSLATRPDVAIGYENWVYSYSTASEEDVATVAIYTESSDSVVWNGNSVKGKLLLGCSRSQALSFGILVLPGVEFSEGKPSDIHNELYLTRARAVEEGKEPIGLYSLAPDEGQLDKLFFVDIGQFASLFSAESFIVEVALKDSPPQVLTFGGPSTSAGLFIASACIRK